MTGQTLLRRAAGAFLIIAPVAPLYALLVKAETGLAGAATVDMARAAATLILGGTLLAAAVGLACSRVVSPQRVDAGLGRLAAFVMWPPPALFAAACAVTGCIASLLVARFVFNLEPVLIDATAQLTHARYLADGMLAAPADTVGFFRTQQTVPVPGGWTSQYPPGHVIALAAGMRAGMPWLIGPALLGVALYFTARAADMMLPARRAAARVGLILASLSPFMLTHAATYMSHTTAAACIGLALYCGARATRPTAGPTAGPVAGPVAGPAPQSERSPASLPVAGWCACAGLAIGAAFTTRPLTGVTIGIVLAVAFAVRAGELRGRMTAVAALATGALPGIVFVALYNVRMFGAPHRFGYDVALGPAAGLGFGMDPWGNTYGIREALAYTSAELTTLSLHLFEAPLPWVAIVGVYLLVKGSESWPESLLYALVLVPLLVSMLYWHHGLFMGPRMLNEYGIVWCVVIATACADIIRAMPPALRGGLSRYSPRAFAAGAFSTAAVLAVIMTPQRLHSLSQPPSVAARALRLAPAGTLVFVHGSWTDRVAMRLAARGWRLDEVETALRQNSTCAVQGVLDGTLGRADLSLAPRATDLPPRIQLPRGSAFRVVPGEAWPPGCARQVAADTAGIVDPASTMWRASSLRAASPVFVRDLGPELNAQLLRYDEATAVVLVRTVDGAPAFLPYRAAMEQLWPTRPR